MTAETENLRSGFVSIIGRPNVGKSTLLNALLGQKVSIVTPKSQTTRNRILGIKTMPGAQIVFIDTPGIHRPKHALGEIIVKTARAALKDVDAVLFIVEPRSPGGDEHSILKLLKGYKTPVILVINKMDAFKKNEALPVIDEYSKLHPFKEIIPISALKGDGIDELLKSVVPLLPVGPKYYPDDLVTDQLERFMVAEIIREKVMYETEEEVPHSSAVEIVSWEEDEGRAVIIINANIYIEKAGQKGIIIGKGGAKLKSIGSKARADIEGLLGSKVRLELWVKVRKLWRSDPSALRELGFR